jgi:Ca-activated chloride channel family protein
MTLAKNDWWSNISSAASVLMLASVLCLGAPPKPGGQTAGHEEHPFTITANVDLVLLDVSVRYPNGGYVKGLQKSDFRVYEDGHPREITQFGAMDAPVSVGLVVDNSGSMRLKRRDVVMAGLAFAKQSNPQDEFFVVNFNDAVSFGLPGEVPFTDNLLLLQRALYYGEPWGETALYDAIGAALAHLERSHREARTLIVVSDGGDNASKISLRELMDMIEASRAVIYTIGLFDPADADQNPKVLRKIAKISGGEYFQPKTENEILPAFQKISTDIRSRYTIGYHPDEIQDKRTLRTVKVTAEKSGQRLIVKSRTTYTVVPFSELLADREQR